MSHNWTPDAYQNQIAESLERLGRLNVDYAKAKAALEKIKDREKPLLAILFRNSDGKSVKDRESEALASEEYAEYLEEKNAALEEFLIADGAFDVAKRRSDFIQSLWSHRREFMKRDS